MRRAFLVIGFCLVAGTALAQGTAGTVELTPTVGYWFGDTLTRGTTNTFDFDVNIDDAPAYGFRIAYRFSDTWALEGFLSRSRANLTTGHGELFGGSEKLGNIDLTTGEIGFEAGFGHSRLVPFLAAGIGAMNLSPDVHGMSSDTRFVGNMGLGFKLFFSPQVALRFDFRGHAVNVGDRHKDCDWWDDHCDSNGEWITFKEVALGLSFIF
jgi:outer membrane beta-barrel protein